MKLVGIVLLYAAAIAIIFLLPAWAMQDAFGASSREASPAQVQREILAAFGSTRGPRAVRIGRCESRTPRRELDPKAVGAAGERGVFQIHPIHFGQPARRGLTWRIDADRLFDVAYNVRVAFEMSRGGRDWGPWSCARKVG